MSTIDRGQLLVQQEDTQKEVVRLQAALRKHSDNLSQFAQKVRSDPERIVFANAPGNLGEYGPDLLNVPPVVWQDLDVIGDIAQKIQQLRAAQRKLQNLQSQLSSR